MAGQDQRHHFIERILRLLRLLEEHQIGIDRISRESRLLEELPPENAREIQAAFEGICFMDEIPGGFFIYRAQGDEQILYANRGVLRIFQCDTLEEFRGLTGNSFRGLVHPEDLEAVEESIWRQIAENRYDLDYVTYRIRRKDGSIRWVEDYGHFVQGDSVGDSVGDVFYVFLGDPSDEKNQQQMEQKRLLMEALERADLAIEAKNAFLSHISHEMRTPLNAIFGFTTLAKTSLGEPGTAAEYLEQIEIAGRRLLDMITKALDVSTLTAASSVHEEACDLCDALQEVYGLLLPRAEEKSVALSLDCGRVAHRGVYTDLKRLKQLVFNLTSNAVTYTEAGGRVDIAVSEERELPDSRAVYRLEVRDTGIGMREEFLKKAFEPFSREKSSTLSGIGGIGLGLTIVKSIVDMLDGTISVESRAGQGSTFTVTLILRVQPLPDPGRKDGPRPGLRILLAEDNDINREIETELLERQGFTVIPAADGRETLDRVTQASPGDYDVIIMDIQMPGMNGWEVSAAIRQLPDPAVAHIPIIALSANVAITDRRRSLESGIDFHLPKPMNLDELLETIEKAVGNAHG